LNHDLGLKYEIKIDVVVIKSLQTCLKCPAHFVVLHVSGTRVPTVNTNNDSEITCKVKISDLLESHKHKV